MSSDARLRALERSGDRQAYLRECWRVGGVAMFEAALRPGDEVEVDSYFADRRPSYAVKPGTFAVVFSRSPMVGVFGVSARSGFVRQDCEWEIGIEHQDLHGRTRTYTYTVSWLRPRGV